MRDRQPRPLRPAELPGAQPPAAPAVKAGCDPTLQSAAAEQDRRDRDHVGILQQELDSEARNDAALMQRGQPGPGAEKRSAADAQRLTEELYDRQKNSQSLNAELRRARSAH